MVESWAERRVDGALVRGRGREEPDQSYGGAKARAEQGEMQISRRQGRPIRNTCVSIGQQGEDTEKLVSGSPP